MKLSCVIQRDANITVSFPSKHRHFPAYHRSPLSCCIFTRVVIAARVGAQVPKLAALWADKFQKQIKIGARRVPRLSVPSRRSYGLCVGRICLQSPHLTADVSTKRISLEGDITRACNWANIFCKPDSFANIMVGWDSIAVIAHLG